MAGLLLPVLLGAAAFAIDLAWVRVVHNQLQNAADAAALAGAHPLTSAVPTELMWTDAEGRARQTVRLNMAEGRELIPDHAEVNSGHWNPKQAQAQLVQRPHSPSTQEVPAVEVVLRKTGNLNDGPATTFLARIWSINGIDTSARAIAGRVAPGKVHENQLFPMAISRCLYDNYWNRLGSPPGPRLDPKTLQPIVFKIGSTYDHGPCDTAQWTSLTDRSNSASVLRKMIVDGTAPAVSAQSLIWVQQGKESSLYGKDLQDCIKAGTAHCTRVLVPVLQTLNTGALNPVYAFACLRLLGAKQGQDYVLAQMSSDCPTPQGSGVGPDLGVLLPPRLLQ